MDTIASFLRDVFRPEYDRFVAAARRRRRPFVALLVALGCVAAYSFVYSRWPVPVQRIRELLHTPSTLWMSLAFLLWLLALTYVICRVGWIKVAPDVELETAEASDRAAEDARAIDLSSAAIRLPDALGAVELLLVAAGEFSIGGRANKEVCLDAYHIGRVPITNAQYKRFVEGTGHASPSHWTGRQIPYLREDHPVLHVSWHDARAYCAWLSRETSIMFRLPTEAEWEKAAQGPDRQTYPWGDQWDRWRCNCAENELAHTEPVGTYSPDGDSPYGVSDMAGNVWEWTSSLNKDLPYNANDGRENSEAQGERILRGGSFRSYADQLACAYRSVHGSPEAKGDEIGFRVAASDDLAT